MTKDILIEAYPFEFKKLKPILDEWVAIEDKIAQRVLFDFHYQEKFQNYDFTHIAKKLVLKKTSDKLSLTILEMIPTLYRDSQFTKHTIIAGFTLDYKTNKIYTNNLSEIGRLLAWTDWSVKNYSRKRSLKIILRTLNIDFLDLDFIPYVFRTTALLRKCINCKITNTNTFVQQYVLLQTKINIKSCNLNYLKASFADYDLLRLVLDMIHTSNNVNSLLSNLYLILKLKNLKDYVNDNKILKQKVNYNISQNTLNKRHTENVFIRMNYIGSLIKPDDKLYTTEVIKDDNFTILNYHREFLDETLQLKNCLFTHNYYNKAKYKSSSSERFVYISYMKENKFFATAEILIYYLRHYNGEYSYVINQFEGYNHSNVSKELYQLLETYLDKNKEYLFNLE